MPAEITVTATHQGIQGIAHGDYLAGLLAQRHGQTLQVTLRKPPPLDTALLLDDDLTLWDTAGSLIMEAGPTEVESDLPMVSTVEAGGHPPHPRFQRHPYPLCFVCGTERTDGFGLRFSAPDNQGRTLGVWTPSGPLVPADELVPVALVWAVVDCLSAWSFADHWGDPAWWPAVTGQMAVELLGPVRRDRPHAVVGRTAGRQGRRIRVEAAIADAEGSVRARAETTWITVPTPPRP